MFVGHVVEQGVQRAELKLEEGRKAAEAEANRKVMEAANQAEQERQPRAAQQAEEKRKADEAEQQRLAVVKAEQDRQAKAAQEAEAKRQADEAEQQRLAAIKAEQERKARLAPSFPRRILFGSAPIIAGHSGQCTCIRNPHLAARTRAPSQICSEFLKVWLRACGIWSSLCQKR